MFIAFHNISPYALNYKYKVIKCLENNHTNHCTAKQIKYINCNKYYIYLSYDVVSGSEITPCNKIDKPLVVYRFTGNVMTSITTLRRQWQNYNVFTPEMRFQSICHMINRI